MANFANEFPECISHSALVCGRGIAATLWHDSPLVEAPWCPHGSEVYIVGVYSCLEEGIGHVHLAKYLPLPTVCKYVIDTG